MSTILTASYVRPNPMRTFDPIRVARYEKDCWVAYYQRRWLTLLRLLIGLVRSTYGLSLWQAIRVGLPLTRAQLAFAPQENDVPQAIAQMRLFFVTIQKLHHEDFDPDAAALAESDLVGGASQVFWAQRSSRSHRSGGVRVCHRLSRASERGA